MKWLVPDYYPDFRCIAGDCRHSCCIGWEIDIDGETLEKYQAVEGAFGKRLEEGIAYSEGQASFRLCEGERCPFLNAEGLCDIILTLGENALSQICTDHPRFRNFFSDREETGLGLCCEAAGRLILGKRGKVIWLAEGDDGEREALTEFEEEILSVREHMTEIAQNRALPLDVRMDAMLDAVGVRVPEISLSAWCDFYLSLERLDPAWGNLLVEARDGDEADFSADEIALEQLLVYFLFRHVAGAADETDIAARAAFAVHAVRMIRSLLAVRCREYSLEALVETARMYSSEIEYSDENLQAILDALVSR